MALGQLPSLGVTPDQQGQFDLGQLRQQILAPKLGATLGRRIVAALGIGPRKAEGHGRHADAPVAVEGLAVHPEPAAQNIAGAVVERQAALVHPPAGRLAADQQTRLREHPHHRPGLVRQLARTGAAGGDLFEQGGKGHPGQYRRPYSAGESFGESAGASPGTLSPGRGRRMR